MAVPAPIKQEENHADISDRTLLPGACEVGGVWGFRRKRTTYVYCPLLGGTSRHERHVYMNRLNAVVVVVLLLLISH